VPNSGSAPSDEEQARALAQLLSGERLVTLEPANERLYFHAKDQRLHRSKLMAWWRRGWIEIEGEELVDTMRGGLGRSRKRLWELTNTGRDAIESAGVRL